MKISAQQQSKLDKVFALYNDSAAKETEESNAALAKLQELCSKYKIDFTQFMKSKGIEVQTTENVTSNASASVTVCTSRRAFIIAKMRENVWCKDSLAEAIALYFGDRYANLKKNKAAVSGTIYDVTSNGKLKVKVCDKTGRIVVG